jgi:hypothetical protein
MGHPMGAPYVHPTGAHYFFFLVARPLAFGSFPAPVMHPVGVHMGALKGTHYKRACEQVTLRVNFGHFSRNLAQN